MEKKREEQRSRRRERGDGEWRRRREGDGEDTTVCELLRCVCVSGFSVNVTFLTV